MKILFLTTVLPRKKRMGSEVASQAVIDALTELGNEVTVIGYVRTDDDYQLAPGEVAAGRRPIETKHAGFYPAVWYLRSLMLGIPYSVSKYWSNSFAAIVREALRRSHYDLVILDHIQMSWLIHAVPLTGKLIGMTHNVEHEMYQGFSSEKQGWVRRRLYTREAQLIGQIEAVFAHSVDQLWTLTRHDAAFFSGLKPRGEVREIALSSSIMPPEVVLTIKGFDIGLIGSWTWQANEDGLRWFFDAVYPHLPCTLDIQVAGNGAGWLTGRFPNVMYRGFVDDAQAFLRAARVIAIPTLSGGGIQIKTLDAIASGSQIVATLLALRGITDPPPTISVAETPQQFAILLSSALTRGNSGEPAMRATQWSRERRTRFHKELDGAVRALPALHNSMEAACRSNGRYSS